MTQTEMAQQLIADFKQHEFPVAPDCAERRMGPGQPQDASSEAHPSPYTLEMDEARLRTMETHSGCDEE